MLGFKTVKKPVKPHQKKKKEVQQKFDDPNRKQVAFEEPSEEQG